MLTELSPFWLLALAAGCWLVAFMRLCKISRFVQQLFRPFKKGKTYWARVTAVSDGDTLTLYRFNLRRSETRIRFAYIDAPESSQSYGPETRRLVKTMLHQKVVRVKITDIDRYGRHVGVIYRYRKNVNEELVKRGAAWVYEDYIRDRKQLAHMRALQTQARARKKGLWKSSRPVRPSVYRKQNRK